MKRSTAIRTTLFVLATSASLVVYSNCSGGFSSVTQTSDTTTVLTTGASPTAVIGQANVMPVTVGCGYVNEPCVTVTICIPGTTQCQTIPNVLLDTGSYGLRLFSQVSLDNFNTLTNLLSVPLELDPSNSSHVITECVSYADGSSEWGPLATVNVNLASEIAPNVPMQIIKSTFASMPSNCQNPDVSPMTTGYNGILGVGLFTSDCGDGCATSSANEIYYSCPSSGTGTCTGVAVQDTLQTSNPVSYLPVDNNGVILELPSVASTFGLADGTSSLSGVLVLGIGTQSNNAATGVTTFQADGNGNFITIFNGVTSSSSFVDSGSNGLYFTASLPACSDNTSFYCPTSEQTLTATQQGAGGSPNGIVTFQVGNADDEFSQSNPNNTFSDLAGVMSSDFDWGLPFFFGRNVYVGTSGKSSTLGAGPLWAY
jgi:hypothetical protein